MRKKILCSVYAISPYKGSEFGAAWQAVTNLALEYDVWVLYGVSDEHMGDTQTMKEYLKTHTVPGVTFVEVTPGALARTINRLNKLGFTWSFYLAFSFWQKKAYREARKMLKSLDIDVVHQWGPIGFREPGYLWKLNKPFVWGPITATRQVNAGLLKNPPAKVRLMFSLRNAITIFQLKHSRRVKKAMKRADVLIAATSTDQANIKKYFNRDSYHLPEHGLLKNAALNYSKFDYADNCVHVVCSGRHVHGKNLQVCLEAFSMLKAQNWVLHFVGNGPLTKNLQQLASEYNISDKVIWHGHVAKDEAIRIMSGTHLHIFTSITEANSTVLFEAVSYGVPTLTIDHCGMRDIVSDKSGIKVPASNYKNLVRNIADKLEYVMENPAVLKSMADETIKSADQYTWDKRLRQLEKVYNRATEHWRAMVNN